RSAEDIQAALKSILLKHKCSIIMRKFDIDDGFEIYAYIVFKDQKYIRCEVPGVVTYDFARDLASNKKISKTQQYASYQSYAKKYALSNLLMIDDSQNDLDATTNQNIQNEKQRNSKQNYQTQVSNRVVTQTDCDRALKQINDLPVNTPIQQAVYVFDGLRSQYPEFDQVLYEAGRTKYQEIMRYLESLGQQQNAHQDANSNTIPAVNKTGNNNNQSNNLGPANNQTVAHHVATDANTLITSKQFGELETFIDERGLRMIDVCNYLAIDSLKQVRTVDLDSVKADIEKMAHEELQQ
ncbi:ERF family protein, partial [Acinetobacter haemolyticus]